MPTWRSSTPGSAAIPTSTSPAATTARRPTARRGATRTATAHMSPARSARIDNDFGVVGVAPGARVWAVKILNDDGYGLLSWYVCGLDWILAQRDPNDPTPAAVRGREHERHEGRLRRPQLRQHEQRRPPPGDLPASSPAGSRSSPRRPTTSHNATPATSPPATTRSSRSRRSPTRTARPAASAATAATRGAATTRTTRSPTSATTAPTSTSSPRANASGRRCPDRATSTCPAPRWRRPRSPAPSRCTRRAARTPRRPRSRRRSATSATSTGRPRPTPTRPRAAARRVAHRAARDVQLTPATATPPTVEARHDGVRADHCRPQRDVLRARPPVGHGRAGWLDRLAHAVEPHRLDRDAGEHRVHGGRRHSTGDLPDRRQGDEPGPDSDGVDPRRGRAGSADPRATGRAGRPRGSGGHDDGAGDRVVAGGDGHERHRADTSSRSSAGRARGAAR